METTTHAEWVEAGYCPEVDDTGAWCIREAGHGDGLHETPVEVDGRAEMYRWGLCESDAVNGGVEGVSDVGR